MPLTTLHHLAQKLIFGDKLTVLNRTADMLTSIATLEYSICNEQRDQPFKHFHCQIVFAITLLNPGGQ